MVHQNLNMHSTTTQHSKTTQQNNVANTSHKNSYKPLNNYNYIYTDGGYKQAKPEIEKMFFPTTKQNNINKATAGPTLPKEELIVTAIHISDFNKEGHMVAYNAESITINWANFLNYYLQTS
jgi:hypothetical protein